jgi:phenylacetic acid degradation operon negative regulatory protein
MVAFDIPEKKKIIRNYFRRKLIEFGFWQFQKSIWICAYDVLKEIKEIMENLQIEKFVRIFLIEEKEI